MPRASTDVAAHDSERLGNRCINLDLRNVAAALFRLEHNRDEQDMLDVLGTLVEWLKAPKKEGLPLI
ncbi:hypothetical protein R5R73_05795 [Salinicola sp. LHM]|uniref:hypothetical protein n=1 Tax=Salinicola TaxID=404432 RepID=UPI000B402138|nr:MULTISPECIES: hypothetical protein [Salinicola]WQH34199.1 hypothetical protein R5R73_05795 [Salinicola sp. LHM]